MHVLINLFIVIQTITPLKETAYTQKGYEFKLVLLNVRMKVNTTELRL